MTTQAEQLTEHLTYSDIRQGREYRIRKENGFWRWESIGRCAYLELEDDGGFHDIKQCKREARSMIALASEWGDESFDIFAKTIPIFVEIDEDEQGQACVWAMNCDGITKEAIVTQPAMFEFIDDAYSWSSEWFEKGYEFVIRMTPQKWAGYVELFAI